MNKRILIGLAALACLALASPSNAGVGATDNRWAYAYGYHSERISQSSYRATSWSLEVQAGVAGSWWYMHLHVDLCTIESDYYNCTEETSRYGYGDGIDGSLDVDMILLESAHLDALLPLQNEAGATVPTHIVADWAGNGLTDRSRGASADWHTCGAYGSTFAGSGRFAEASASADGASIGNGYGAIGSGVRADAHIGC